MQALPPERQPNWLASTKIPKLIISTGCVCLYFTAARLEMFDGEVEADESYFGGHLKGRRGCGAAGKVAVFGLLKGNGKVYTVAVPNTQTATLLPIIREQVRLHRRHGTLPRQTAV